MVNMLDEVLECRSRVGKYWGQEGWKGERGKRGRLARGRTGRGARGIGRKESKQVSDVGSQCGSSFE